MPSVSAGSVPYRTFSGEACSTAIDLITIPEVQEFIVTMVTSTAQAHNSANVSYPYDVWTKFCGMLPTHE